MKAKVKRIVKNTLISLGITVGILILGMLLIYLIHLLTKAGVTVTVVVMIILLFAYIYCLVSKFYGNKDKI